MILKATIRNRRSLKQDLDRQARQIEQGVVTAHRKSGRALNDTLRTQIRSAGMGNRLANTWRTRVYPNKDLNAASFTFSKVPHIIHGHDTGARIVADKRAFLAVPTRSAPKRGTDGKKVTPATWPTSRFGELYLVNIRGKRYLAVSYVRRTPKGRYSGRPKGGAFTKRGKLKARVRTRVFMFRLVHQTKLKKSLNVQQAADKAFAELPGRIDEELYK